MSETEKRETGDLRPPLAWNGEDAVRGMRARRGADSSVNQITRREPISKDRIMRNRYWQTLLTYARHGLTRLWMIIMGLTLTSFLAAGLLTGSSEDSGHSVGGMSFLRLQFSFFIAFTIAAQLRRQFIDARATTLPRFRTTSLWVAASVWGFFFFWFVVLLWVSEGLSTGHAIRLLLPISALALWAGYCGSWAAILFICVTNGLVIVSARFDDAATVAWLYGPGGPFDSVPASLVAIAALVGLGVRLMRVREGMVEFDWSDPSEEPSLDWKPRQGATHPGRRAGQWWRRARWFQPSDRQIRRLRRSRPWGIFGHTRRWAAAQRLRWQIAWLGPAVALFLLVSGWRHEASSAPWSCVRFMQLYAAPMTLGVMTWRAEFLGTEILRPASRWRFFVAVGLAVVAIQAAAWMVINGSLLALIGCSRPEFLVTRELWQSLLVSASFQPFLLGCVAWIYQHRHVPVTFLLVALAVVAVPVLVFLLWNPAGQTWLETSIGAGIFLALGCALSGHQWRRWAQTEFD